MIQILKDMGITEYEPRVINQMLEFTYSKYTFNSLRLVMLSVQYCMFSSYKTPMYQDNDQLSLNII